ncbi:DUF1707 domain-containing protein [Actinomadura sp. 9N407]|uniref:DUF1707 domain-containing protein n=1 Tax=Actinomadura sp. 9N407 TaxID=3375154 RepID=UPI00378F8B53
MVTAPDEMRIGDAERDAVTSALHEHFAAGRLDREELDERLGTALAAKTQGALRTIVKDLPGPNGLPGTERPVPAHWTHAHAHAFAHAQRYGHPARVHHRGPFPAFPLMLGVFIFMTFAVGIGAAMLTVLQVAMLVWIVRAVTLAVGARRARPR